VTLQGLPVSDRRRARVFWDRCPKRKRAASLLRFGTDKVPEGFEKTWQAVIDFAVKAAGYRAAAPRREVRGE